MGLADELRKLRELRDAGTLTEAEFTQAKAALIAPSTADALGVAAKSWVRFHIVSGIVSLVLVVVVLAYMMWQVTGTWRQADQRTKDFERKYNLNLNPEK